MRRRILTAAGRSSTRTNRTAIDNRLRLGAPLVSAALAAGGWAGSAFAESHALIMTIGNYSNPAANLRGIDVDAANARKIALSMGVPAGNITELRDSQLSSRGIADAMNTLSIRIRAGDKVFVYYSGHGGQEPADGANACREGIVAHDLKLYPDSQFTADLQRVAARAGQVIMFNDSCFSGGLVDEAKTLNRSLYAAAQGKAIRLAKTGGLAGATDGGYTCGQAVNAKMSRNLQVIKADGSRYVYIAAASDREVAWATSSGSSATNAWLRCLTSGTDRDRSGVLTGGEIQRCAQSALAGQYNQTITLVGDSSLPLSLVGESSVGGSGSAEVNPANALRDLAAGASDSIRVQIRASNDQLTIGRDALDFTVNTDKAGYLYLLHVGSDGKTFDLLFPNSVDSSNYVQAGTHALPRPSWRVKAGGPPGTSYVMAVLAETPREFDKGMGKMGPFRSAPATAEATKNLYSSAANDATGGRYGASTVLGIREINP